MQIDQKLVKSLPALGKFAAWLGISVVAGHLAESAEIETALSATGVITNLDAACKIVDGLASGKLNDYYKDFRGFSNFGINHDLQNAFRQGIANGLDELCKDFIKKNNPSEEERKQIKLFFRSLATHLSNGIDKDADVEEYVLNRGAFFFNLLRIVNNTATESDEDGQDAPRMLIPDVPDISLAELALFVTAHLEPYVHRFINQELKNNDHAKTAYFVYILEFGARINHSNSQLLLGVKGALAEIARKQDSVASLLQTIAEAQQSINDSLSKLRIDFKHFVEDFEDFAERVNSQFEPVLELSQPDARNIDQSFSYHYGLRYTGFIGRDTEVGKLWDFLIGQPDRRFLWWMTTGPGGMGKSRLALEFCLKVRHVGRYAGFVRRSEIARFDWGKWRPKHPTLLVIDYVSTDVVGIANVIIELSRAAQNRQLKSPVRLLLLERELRDDWWSAFKDIDIEDASYVPQKPKEILKLESLGNDDLWRIITEVHTKQGKIVERRRADVLSKLFELDSNRRPLFAFLTGMSLAEGLDIRNWDAHDLLKSLVDREERKIWSRHPKWANENVQEAHKNILLLTTLTRGVTKGEMKSILAEKNEWLPITKLDDGLYNIMSSIKIEHYESEFEEKIYEGLQPDLVGEYYILRRITELLSDDFDGRHVVSSIIRASWILKSWQTWWTVWQTYSDLNSFPVKKVRKAMIEFVPEKSLSSDIWKDWSSLNYNLTFLDEFRQDQDIPYQNIKLAAEVYGSEEILLDYAKATFNLLNYYKNSQERGKALELWQVLKSLSESYIGDAAIALEYAKATFNILNYYITIHDLDNALELWQILKSLSEYYIDDAMVALPFAKATVNLLNYYGNNREPVKALELWQVMKSLSEDYIDDAAIALPYAMATFNLSIDYCNNRDVGKALELLRVLKSLSEYYIGDAAIALRYAKATANLSNYYSKNHEPAKALALWQVLKSLSEGYIGEAVIALEYAMATFNLSVYYHENEEPEKAKELLDVLGDLGEKYSDNNKMILEYYQELLLFINSTK